MTTIIIPKEDVYEIKDTKYFSIKITNRNKSIRILRDIYIYTDIEKNISFVIKDLAKHLKIKYYYRISKKDLIDLITPLIIFE